MTDEITTLRRECYAHSCLMKGVCCLRRRCRAGFDATCLHVHPPPPSLPAFPRWRCLSIPRARITLRVQQRCTSARSIADCSANHSAPVGRFSPNSGFRADFPTSCAASRVVPRAELGGLADSFLAIALARPTRNVSDDTPSRAAQALVLSALGVVGSKRGSPYQGGFERLSRIAREGADNSARTTAMIRLCWMPDTASVFSVF